MSGKGYRNAAKGRECQVRLPGCDRDPSTTVLAHIRYQQIGCGVGLKPPDIMGLWACHSCHSKIDGREPALLPRKPESWESYVLAGLLRTLNELAKEGWV